MIDSEIRLVILNAAPRSGVKDLQFVTKSERVKPSSSVEPKAETGCPGLDSETLEN